MLLSKEWDTRVWEMNGSVCALEVFKDHVKINFFRGAAIADTVGIFNAGLEAKKSRGVDLREGDSLDEAALQATVRRGVSLIET